MKEDSSDDMDILNISDTKEDFKDQPRNSMFMPMGNLSQSIFLFRMFNSGQDEYAIFFISFFINLFILL